MNELEEKIENLQLDDVPSYDGKFVFNKKEILKAILAAIEQWYVSSNTPKDKYILVTGKSITKYVCYGTFNNAVRFEDQDNFKKLKQRVGRWLTAFATEKTGRNSWMFKPEAIDKIREEIGLELTAEIKTEIVPVEEQEKDSMIINLSDFVKTVKAYKCIVCERIYTEESELLLHFRKHKLSEFMEESK